jgi:small subunit ribosomal protein S1
MTEPLENMEALLAQEGDPGAPHRGDLLRGTVIALDSYGAIVDVGLKRDGVILKADLEKVPSGDTRLKVGDQVSVMVVEPIDRDGNLVVSLSQARESGDWLDAQRKLDEEEIFEATPSAHNRGGLIVPFGRLRGFVPASHISDLPRGLDEDGRANFLKSLVGRRMPFRVIEVDPQRQRLVLSERKAIRQWRQDQKGRMMDELREGEVREGLVTSLREFGAFVDIGGADGLIHISELSWQRVEDPGEILSVGQRVEAMIIRLDRQANRIGLSLKRMQPNPWKAAAERIQVGVQLDGTISRLGSAGAFVLIEDGVEGVIPAPEDPAEFPVGNKVRVEVVAFDPERERLEFRPAPAG